MGARQPKKYRVCFLLDNGQTGIIDTDLVYVITKHLKDNPEIASLFIWIKNKGARRKFIGEYSRKEPCTKQ
jgi:hypothetical protein